MFKGLTLLYNWRIRWLVSGHLAAESQSWILSSGSSDLKTTELSRQLPPSHGQCPKCLHGSVLLSVRDLNSGENKSPDFYPSADSHSCLAMNDSLPRDIDERCGRLRVPEAQRQVPSETATPVHVHPAPAWVYPKVLLI